MENPHSKYSLHKYRYSPSIVQIINGKGQLESSTFDDGNLQLQAA